MLRLITGNSGKRPLNRCEPPAPPVIPEPPAFLNAAVLAGWHRCTPSFKDSGLLSMLDRDALACLTPSSRTRIKIDDPAELDDFDRCMAGDPSWLHT